MKVELSPAESNKLVNIINHLVNKNQAKLVEQESSLRVYSVYTPLIVFIVRYGYGKKDYKTCIIGRVEDIGKFEELIKEIDANQLNKF